MVNYSFRPRMPGHGHSHGGCEGHDHDHVTDADRASAYSLYLKIDTERVQCLNEAEEGSAKYVFKPWDKRLDKEKVLDVLLNISCFYKFL